MLGFIGSAGTGKTFGFILVVFVLSIAVDDVVERGCAGVDKVLVKNELDEFVSVAPVATTDCVVLSVTALVVILVREIPTAVVTDALSAVVVGATESMVLRVRGVVWVFSKG